jgi:glucokinase
MQTNESMKDLVIGVDVGGTSTDFGFVDAKGQVISEHNLITAELADASSLVESLWLKCKELGFLDRIKGIGIGAPNGNFFTGTIEFAPNLKWKGIIPLAKLFSNRFQTEALLTNDANAAAIGEMLYGNARDLKDFVTITLGTGLGSGVIAGGELIYGHDGFAGEYGHIRVIPNGRLCGCGRKGCLETYVSATGVVRSIKEFDHPTKASSPLLSIDHPHAEDVFEAARKNDPFAMAIIEYTAETLGSALADYACFSSPKAYVLFGGIAQSGESFAVKVKDYMEKHLLNIYQNKIEIRISSLHDVNAAVLGAASLIWKKNSHQ